MAYESELKAFNLIRQAAKEYSGAEYKFYQNGFFKFVQYDTTFFIEDIYVSPEFRGTPVSRIMMESFEQYMREQKILLYYGYVHKSHPTFKKRLTTLLSWGMEEQQETDLYIVVSKKVNYGQQ